MAKAKCPSCGAKNDASATRCRICTAMMNPVAAAPAAAAPAPPPEQFAAPAPPDQFAAPPPPMAPGPAPQAPAAGPGAAGPPAAAAAAAAATSPAGAPRRLPPPGYPGAPPAESAQQRPLPDSAISFNVQSRHPGNPVAPPDVPVEPLESVRGITFDVQPRHAGIPAPVLGDIDEREVDKVMSQITIDPKIQRNSGNPPVLDDAEAEAFRRGGGGIVIDVAPRHPGDPALPPPGGAGSINDVTSVTIDVVPRHGAPPPDDASGVRG